MEFIEKWSEIEDGEVGDFGRVIIDLEEKYPNHFFEVDKEMVKILGWSDIPKDDENQPYQVLGLVELGKQKKIIFSYSLNLAMGKDYWYASAYQISDEQENQIKAWLLTAKRTPTWTP